MASSLPPLTDSIAHLPARQISEIKSLASRLYALCCDAETQQETGTGNRPGPSGGKRMKKTLPADQQLKLLAKRKKTMYK